MELTAKTNDVYFVTLTVVYWIDIFTRPVYKDVVIKNLEFCRKNKGLEIYSYVIMTNHLHLILRAKEKTLSELLRDFKSFTSKELYKLIKENPQESRKDWIIRSLEFAGKINSANKYHQFWQNDNYPIVIDSNKQFTVKQNYIHENPVRSGFVAQPHEYLYSSANEQSPLKVDEY